MGIGPLTFLAPLALLGLIALPLIWWLLRVTPPSPKKQDFPPLRILQDVMTEEETPDHTPFWLLLFRLLMVAIIAFALARPILTEPEGVSSKPLTLIIDNGWDAAPNWAGIVREAEARLTDARRKNVDVMLVTTAGSEAPFAFTPAQEAMNKIKSLKPFPYAPDRALLAKQLADTDISASEAVWLSGGLDFGGTASLAAALKRASTASRLAPTTELTPIVPGDIAETANGFRSVWHRYSSDSLQSNEVTAHGRDGRVIARADLNFAPGGKTAEAIFELPSELRSRVTALRVSGLASAGAMRLLDDSWGRPLVGLLTTSKDEASPLLSEPFYAETALKPHADLFTGNLNDLLPLAPSIIVMPDVARTESEELRDYVKNGGLLIRFAGPKLAARPDGLLPVTLRDGGRALGGALTWEDPQNLAPFSEDSPFFGLNIPKDLAVTRQVMAQPGTETDNKTWARLEDGSPIVTSDSYGLGRIVLFHVTAGPEWSNLPVGGLYVDMLKRILPLAKSAPAPNVESSGDWAPERLLNGYGRLTAPGADARPIADGTFENVEITAKNPPGLYRQGARRQALNAVRDPNTLSGIGSFSGIAEQSYGQTRQRTLGGLLLGFAIAMLILDALFAILASGRTHYFKLRRSAPAAATLIFACVVFMPQFAQAQTSDQIQTDALGLHLGYVITGDSRLDQMSASALEGLSGSLTRRTTIEPTGVRGVDPSADPLMFYPFLYWPVSRDAPSLSEKASAALNAYMASGGTIVFDTQDQGDRAALGNMVHPGLERITASLDVPALGPVPEDHVLTKSFYLMQTFPGRWANGTVWVDKNPSGAASDGVSSVIIGSNDWAAGWALTEDGEPIVSLETDIPRQREWAIRFGVNVAMYALSGNYKSDQVHAAALVERLGRPVRQPENLGPSRQDGPGK